MAKRYVRGTCERCGVAFLGFSRAQRYCSRACHYASATGQVKVTGTTYVRGDGYVAVKTGLRRYELQHRLVAEESLGRPLLSAEHVHHVNGVKTDNRPVNLLVMTRADHQRLHAATDHVQAQPHRVQLNCQRCGAQYDCKLSRVAKSKYCSEECRLQVLHDVTRARWAAKRKGDS